MSAFEDKREAGLTFLDPLIIAEAGVNHGGSMSNAEKMIDLAAEAGAHAVKFQAFKAGRLTSRVSPAFWDTSLEPTVNQYELYKRYDVFGPSEYRYLAEHCRKRGIMFMATPYDSEAVDVLDDLMLTFKVSSTDITNLPLLRKIGSRNKPVILSTGAATLPEIEQAIQVLRTAGAPEVALLHAVLNYPTAPENACLAQISLLKKTFPDCLVGYSDHVAADDGLSALEAAALLGAVILEKHFTHDKNLQGNDHYHAMDAGDLARFIQKLTRYRELYGAEARDLTGEAVARRNARRSIVAGRDIQRGEVLTEENLTVKRPATGMSPMFWDSVVGRRAARDIPEDTFLDPTMFTAGE